MRRYFLISSISKWPFFPVLIVIEQLFHFYIRPGNLSEDQEGLSQTGSNSRLRPNFTTPIEPSPQTWESRRLWNCIGGCGHARKHGTPSHGSSAHSCITVRGPAVHAKGGPALLSEALHNLRPSTLRTTYLQDFLKDPSSLHT